VAGETGPNEERTMKGFTMALAAGALAATLTPGTILAVDWVKAAPRGKTVLVDNEHVRMVEVVIPPGGKEPSHTHPEYIEYVISPAKMKVTYDGKAPEIWDAEVGKAYYGQPDPPHALENVDTKFFRILLVELKDKPYVPTK
jgi:quercetin dioxygenase-like cupin family protein